MKDWLQTKATIASTALDGVHIQSSPDIQETSSCLTVTCYSSNKKQHIVPCKFSWFRSKNGLTTQIPSVTGSSYMCQPSDIGSIIKVELESQDKRFPGVSMIQFGPIRMDMTVRRDLERILIDGFHEFSASLSNRETKIQMKSDTLSIHQHTYRHQELTLSTILKTTNAISVANQQRNFQLHFQDRHTRDLFLFAYDAFKCRRQLEVSQLIHQVERLRIHEHKTFDLLMETESLRRDLYRVVIQNTKLSDERDRLLADNTRLLNEVGLLRQNYERMNESRKNTLTMVDAQKINNDIAQTYSHIFSAIKQGEKEQGQPVSMFQAEQISRNVANGFLDIIQSKSPYGSPSHTTPTTHPSGSTYQEAQKLLSPVQKEQLGRMAVSIQPPDSPTPLEQKQQHDIIELRNYANKSYKENLALRDHINKISAQLAWFYSQHGQPTLPLRLRYRVSQQTNQIKEQPSVNEKSKQLEQVMMSLHDSFTGNMEIQRLNKCVSRLVNQNKDLQEKHQSATYRISYLEDSIKKKEQDGRMSLNKILEQNCVIQKLQQILYKLQHPSPHKVNITYNGQSQNVMFRSHDYTVNITSMVKEMEALRVKNNQLLREKSEIDRIKNINNADLVMLQIEKRQMEQSNKDLTEKLQKVEAQMLMMSRKSTKIQTKLTDIIAHNGRMHDKREEQLQTRHSHTIKMKDEEIIKLYQAIKEKQSVVQRLDFEVRKLFDQNQQLQRWQARHKKKQEQLQQELKMLRVGQDALNKSRELCSQMDSFHAEQNSLLKQQYELLKAENDKLTSMCEKYHAEAKESLRLRQQIVKLNEKIHSQ